MMSIFAGYFENGGHICTVHAVAYTPEFGAEQLAYFESKADAFTLAQAMLGRGVMAAAISVRDIQVHQSGKANICVK